MNARGRRERPGWIPPILLFCVVLLVAGTARAADDPYVPGGTLPPPLPIDNAAFASSSGEPTTLLGVGGGTNFVAACPAGSALVGWTHNALLQLTAIAPICQRVVEGELLGTPGPAPAAVVGAEVADAAGGGARRCADHTAVRGLEAALTVERTIFAIRSVCHAVTGPGVPVAGSWTSYRILKSRATEAYPPKDRRGVTCTSAGYAVGLTGTFSAGGAITSIGLLCQSQGAVAGAPAPPRLDRGALRAATVVLSVDVFAAPGGAGASTGSLEAGTAGVTYVEACQGDWCHVRWPAGEGWVYSGPDYNALGR